MVATEIVSVIVNPITVFLVSLVVAIILLTYMDLPPFLGLILSAFVVGIISPRIPLSEVPSQVAEAFGSVMTAVGIPILMAAVIGKCLIDSGAAERIVRSVESLVSQEDITLLGSSYLFAIPVFFDNVFYLLAPLARSMRGRSNSDRYALYISAIVAGGSITHALIPPTPGPLAVANQLNIDLGLLFLVGTVLGIPTAIVGGIVYGRWIDRRLDIPSREAMGTATSEITEMMRRNNEELPSTFEAVLPILLAIVLIMLNTVSSLLLPAGSPIVSLSQFFGNANIALTIAALTAAVTLYQSEFTDRDDFEEKLSVALRDGGMVIAITAAGGAFGSLLGAAGIGDSLVGFTTDLGLSLIITSWILAALLIIATGSLTAALLTTAEIIAPLLGQLSVHPVYIAIAIGMGGMFFPWYNSSPFWIIREISGLSSYETLCTFTFTSMILSVTGISLTVLMSSILPLT